jgi:hypothetical protein
VDPGSWPEGPYCAHAGVINTIEQAKKVAAESRVLTVIGGRHLTTASEEAIEKSVDETGVVVTDFNGQRYRIELERGAGSIVESPARA